ncbi:hypothetical protein T484DRAFT_2125112 [Baffinella frigidus]|nr:hypothetical protein T484DRAFT_2125112 [Cryptophyta sp. CCMP2293]
MGSYDPPRPSRCREAGVTGQHPPATRPAQASMPRGFSREDAPLRMPTGRASRTRTKSCCASRSWTA